MFELLKNTFARIVDWSTAHLVPTWFLPTFGFEFESPTDMERFVQNSNLMTEHTQENEERALGSVKGRKKQLLTHGLNYRGTRAELRGCINDSNNVMQYMVQECGVTKVLQMTDDTPLKPTYGNITNSIKMLMSDVGRVGGTAFYHYSGHGSQVPDRNGDEMRERGRRGKDECLCPLDYQYRGMIIDDDLNRIILDAACSTDEPVRVIGIFDCCHSGSMLDLKYKYGPRVKGGPLETTENPKASSHEANVVMISGCRDTQTSADVQPAPGKAFGALTNSLLTVLRRHQGKCTWRTLIDEVNRELAHHSQISQLSSQMPLDLDTPIDW